MSLYSEVELDGAAAVRRDLEHVQLRQRRVHRDRQPRVAFGARRQLNKLAYRHAGRPNAKAAATEQYLHHLILQGLHSTTPALCQPASKVSDE